MIQQATVKAVTGEEALLTVKRQSICEGCHKEGGCHSCSQVLEVRVKNTCFAEVGDVVEIETGSGAVIGVAALVFLLPLVLAFVAYFLLDTLTGQSLYGYLGALGALVVTYTVIAVTVRRLNKTLSVSMTAIVEKKNGGKDDTSFADSDSERQTDSDYE